MATVDIKVMSGPICAGTYTITRGGGINDVAAAMQSQGTKLNWIPDYSRITFMDLNFTPLSGTTRPFNSSEIIRMYKDEKTAAAAKKTPATASVAASSITGAASSASAAAVPVIVPLGVGKQGFEITIPVKTKRCSTWPSMGTP